MSYSLSEDKILQIIEEIKKDWGIEYINAPFICEYMECELSMRGTNWDHCCDILQVAKWCEKNTPKQFHTKVIARKK